MIHPSHDVTRTAPFRTTVAEGVRDWSLHVTASRSIGFPYYSVQRAGHTVSCVAAVDPVILTNRPGKQAGLTTLLALDAFSLLACAAITIRRV